MIQAEGLLIKGWYKRCEKALQSILELSESLQNPTSALIAWHVIACRLHIALGDWPNARAMIMIGSEYAKSAGEHHHWTEFKVLEGVADLAESNIAAATQHFEEAIELCTQHRYLVTILEAWRGMASLYRKTHAFDKATATAKKCTENRRRREQSASLPSLLTSQRAGSIPIGYG